MSLYGILQKKVAVGTGLNIYINQAGMGVRAMLARKGQAVYTSVWPSTVQQDHL
jgi:hypothetical protein